MQSGFTVAFLLVSCVIIYTKANPRGSTPDPRINLKLGPLTGGKSPWSFSGKGVSGKSGLEGFSLTGKWSPPGTGNSFNLRGPIPDPKFNLKLGPLTGGKSPWSFSGKGLTGKSGVEGFSLTGKWSPPGTGNSFSGTGLWRDGKGFGGSLGGSVDIGKGTSLLFNFGGGAGEPASGSLGVKIGLGRRRRARPRIPGN